MQARSALFALYGEYLRCRGGRAPVAALVRLLAPVGIAAPAVRTTVSRMVRQGWLLPLRLAAGPGYQLTPEAAHQLDEAAARIHRPGRPGWDDRFDMVLIRPPVSRRRRARLDALSRLGYGMLDEQTWIAPRAAPDVDAVLIAAAIPYERFTASHAGGTGGVPDVVARAWDLTGLGRAYRVFEQEQHTLLAAAHARSSDEEAYAARFRLVHAWRSLLVRDPQLPAPLLPRRWPGLSAATFFERHANRLGPAADRFVDHCLQQNATRR